MIDFHSHIVYDVDDGSKSLENSINILKEAENAGFNKIILTPHYMENYYMVPKDEIKIKINILKEKCKSENINIELYQGNEIYITNHIAEYLNNNIASSLNDSRYVLFETPLNVEPNNLDVKNSAMLTPPLSRYPRYPSKRLSPDPCFARPQRRAAYCRMPCRRLPWLTRRGCSLRSPFLWRAVQSAACLPPGRPQK